MSRVRIAIGSLTLSAAALVGLATQEGYTSEAVVPVKGDVPTVGFGSTTHEDGRAVQMGDKTTPVKALQRTLAYTQKAEAGFRACIDVPLTQGEFDVYLDFAYQYGMPTLCASSIATHLRAQRYEQACAALQAYRFMSDDQPHPGWEVAQRDSTGRPIRWRFDCSTPGNKLCAGVWTRQQRRHARCMAEQT
ncbi:MAG: lysozyme [Roseateles depolymerans]|uniref:Lysozyme n=1 Tax=Roseateles depolymerans TaxID=76731 RepID=A0A2W5DL30_9BURK|nr:MAG: lysozyme [Roseateles depolymerans]